MLIPLMLWSLGLISQPHFYMSAYLEENKDLYSKIWCAERNKKGESICPFSMDC
jgi:hypothetical protein